MKFYTGPEELKDVIGSYCVVSNNMTVFYLNNRVEVIPNYTEEQEKEVREIMLKQLQERNASINLKSMIFLRNIDTSLLTALTGLYIANRIKFDNIKTYLTITTIIGTIYLTNRIFKEKTIIKEVKKSSLFLDMYEKLQTPEGMKVVEELNFDKRYFEELNVNTLDNFSYGDVKEIHKKLMRVK